MKNSSYCIGRYGEKIAADYITKKGYFISAKNYKSPMGEIDIIAENREYVLFIEVKLRNKNAGYSPKEAVTAKKRRRIIYTAKNYLFRSKCMQQPRFDIIEIIADKINEDGSAEGISINHIENAFGVTEDEFF